MSTVKAPIGTGNGRANGRPGASKNGHAGSKAAGPRPVFKYRGGWQDRIPESLRDRDQWVLWTYEFRGGKWTKVPLKAHAPSQRASSTEPQDWNTFACAARSYAESQGTKHQADGVGFVFAHGGGLVGFDLDGIIAPDGSIDPWGLEILGRLTPTCHEFSPSGKGIKGVVRGELPGLGINRRGLGPDGKFGFEMYSSGRFFTITGDSLDDGSEVEDRSDAILDLYGRFKSKRTEAAGDAPRGAPLAGDDELLDRARRAKNGTAFSALFDEGEFPVGGSHSEADFSLCCRLAFWFNRDAASIDRVFRRSGLMRPKWDESRGGTTYGAYTIANAIEITEEVYTPAGDGDGGGRAGERVDIELTTRRHEVLEQAIAALANDPEIYCRGAALVAVAAEEETSAQLTRSTTLNQAAGSPKIVALSEPIIGCYLTRNAGFFVEKKDRNGEPFTVDAHPPDWLIKAVATRKSWPRIRPLLGVAECPFPREDGSIVETPGYDPETGTYYRPSIQFPSVPDRPTQEDARAAWERLKAPVQQFPFVSEADLAVWFAGLLTVIARPAIPGPVPGVAVIGNKASTGKGLLIDTIGTLGHGRSVPTSVYPADPIEAGKVKTGLAISGKPIIHFDNLEEGSSYGNSSLDSALTSASVDDRILGTSQFTGDVALRLCWFLSGNNIGPSKDAYRRWLPCNLITGLERPEERPDIEIGDLRAYLLEHRAKYVRDALIVLRAHAIAGRPTGKWAPLASFEAWDRIVRGAVWFAGAGDCCATRRQVADEAPARLAKIALLEGWLQLPGGGDGGVTALKAVELATGNPETYPTLYNALIQYGRDGKPAVARSIGNILRAMKGNLIDGMMFVNAGEEHKTTKWRVDKSNPKPPVSQEEGGIYGSGGSPRHPPTRDSGHDNYVTTCGGKCNTPGVGLETDPPEPQIPPSGGACPIDREGEAREKFVL